MKWNDEKLYNICMECIKAESEEGLKAILNKYNLWDDKDLWIDYGRDELNFRNAGNQQAYADAALVEKIINSIDAVITKEALMRNLTPDHPQAPQSVAEAIESFFDVKEGKLVNLRSSRRKELADNIILMATGKGRIGNSKPCISIIDKGEGQLPDNFEDTFLSLSGTNKVRTPYVQGKFNMGSTGVLEFCGNLNLQLIISKRHPTLIDDNVDSPWGFTIVRKFIATDDNLMKIDSYKYLIIDGQIPRFYKNSLKVLPIDGKNIAYGRELNFGTFIKMYNYELDKGLKAQVRKNLYSRLNTLLPQLALPVKIYERRKYTGSDYCVYLNGLYTSLSENLDIIEKEYSLPGFLYYNNKKLPYYIFIFKPGKKTNYFAKEEIILSVNGQMQGDFPKSLIEKANLNYLVDDIVIILDCSNLSREDHGKMFMNSRDRIRHAKTKQLQDLLKSELKDNNKLQNLNREIRNNKIRTIPSSKEKLKTTLTNLLKTTNSIFDTFSRGDTDLLKNPINLKPKKLKERYLGKEFPDIFIPEKEFTKLKPKKVYKNSDFRIFYKTNAENNYFSRPKYPGEIEFKNTSHNIKNLNGSFNLLDGRATLTIKSLPDYLKIDELIEFLVLVKDDYNGILYKGHFYIKIESIKKTGSKNGGGQRKKPTDNNDGISPGIDKREIPKIIPVHEKDWIKEGFNKYSGLKVVGNGNNGFDYYINMDNFYILSHLKNEKKENVELLKEFYEGYLISTGMSIIYNIKEKSKTNKDTEFDEIEEIKKQTRELSKAVSISVVPLFKTYIENSRY